MVPNTTEMADLDSSPSSGKSVEMVSIKESVRHKYKILSLLAVVFLLLGTFQTYPIWLLPNAVILGQTEEERSLSGWLLFAGLFFVGLIGGPFIKELLSEETYTIGTFGALPVSYFLIWCSLLGEDSPGSSWIYFFGCLFTGYAIGGCSSLVVSIITPLFGPKWMAMAVAVVQMFYSYGALSATSLLGSVGSRTYFLIVTVATSVMPIIAYIVVKLRNVKTSAITLDPVVVAVLEKDKVIQPYIDLLRKPTTIPCMLSGKCTHLTTSQ